jgi:uncharacterized protein with HEPN domain
MEKDEKIYLRHILDAIALIEEYITGVDEATFLKKNLQQDGVIRQLEIIGEASNHISKDLQNTYTEVPWADMIGMRHKLIHDYFGVDLEKVWLTAQEDIPYLKEKMRGILSDFGVEL